MKLEVKNITKSFGETQVLHGVSFEVESGKALGLLGRNGAGKTTTMRIIMNVFNANGGDLLIDRKPFIASEYRVGYLPEERGLYPKNTVKEQMLYLARLRGLSKSEALTNISKLLNRLEITEYENRKLETLSKGNQQKVQLAATLVANPDIVILDEPFSGLDPVNSQILKDVVNELIADGKIVIFSSHQMSYVEEFCDNIAIINSGEVVLSGELKEIKKEYGKNRITLSAENFTPAELKTKIEDNYSDFVDVCGLKKEYIILENKEGHTKEEFLKLILDSDIKLDKFGLYEPSLNDIFVSKVGEINE